MRETGSCVILVSPWSAGNFDSSAALDDAGSLNMPVVRPADVGVEKARWRLSGTGTGAGAGRNMRRNTGKRGRRGSIASVW